MSAKNSLQNYNGFSPIQLVTVSLPNLPNVLNSALPALESSESKTEHLNAMQSARCAFKKAEASEKIKRVLRHPVRSCEVIFINGDKVFNKRDDNRCWRGPGNVLGQRGTVVYVLHGSRLFRCSSSRVVKVTDYNTPKSSICAQKGNITCKWENRCSSSKRCRQ